MRWCPDGEFLRHFCVLYFQRAACSTFQTCILNSHENHTMCGSMVDIQCLTAEIRRGNKKTRRKKKPQDENIYVRILLCRADIKKNKRTSRLWNLKLGKLPYKNDVERIQCIFTALQHNATYPLQSQSCLQNDWHFVYANTQAQFLTKLPSIMQLLPLWLGPAKHKRCTD